MRSALRLGWGRGALRWVLVGVLWGPVLAEGSGEKVVELVPTASGPLGAVSRAQGAGGSAVISGELTVAQAVRTALARNPQLQAIRQERARARGAVVEVRSGFLPDLSISGQYFRRVKVPTVSFGPASFALGAPDNWAFGATLVQPLYLGGAVLNAYRAARMGQGLAEEQIRRAAQEVVFQTRRAYYDILVAREFVAADREQVERAQAFLDEVEKRFAQGMASNFDVLRARVELANVQAALIKSQNAHRLARTALLRVMGVSQDSQVTLVDGLRYEPLRPEVREAMRRALLGRPEVLASQLSVKVQEHRLEATKAGLLPKVFLSGDYSLTRPGVGGFGAGWDDEFRATVSFEVPLLEGGETAGKLAQERALLEELRTRVRDAEEQVLLEVTQALLSLEDADEFVRSQMVNLERAREQLRLAEVGFREGVRKQVEVVDARAALTEARKNFSQAVFSHMVARLNLERATGALARAARSEGDSR